MVSTIHMRTVADVRSGTSKGLVLAVIVLMALSGLALVPGPAGAEDRQTPTITIDTDVTYQTISAWEATAWMGQDSSPNLANYSDEVIDLAVNELGLNRLRLEVRAGVENPEDYWTQWQEGIVDYDFWRSHRYTTVNDNADADVINWSSFHFSELDNTVEKVVLPFMANVTANGGTPIINLNYVAFTGQNGAGLAYIHNDADEYAEMMLATFIHLDTKYDLVPDYLEVILEPDNVAQWTGYTIGDAVVATEVKLATAGYHPKFIAPSNTNMGGAITYFDQLATVTGAVDALEELSYHRYGGVSDANLQTINTRRETYGLKTSMLEHIGSGHDDLHKDLTEANCSSWQQFALAGFGPGDSGGVYFLIDETDPSDPVVSMGWRTKFLRQYFHYVEPGAVRVDAASDEAGYDPVGFINPDGSHVVVVNAASSGTVIVNGLPAASYGITYTTSSAYDVALSEQTLGTGGSIMATIPAAGVMTIYEIRRAPMFDPYPSEPEFTMFEDQTASFSVTPTNYDKSELTFKWSLDDVEIVGADSPDYSYYADFNASGYRRLVVTVRDTVVPTLHTDFVWYLTIHNVNRAPIVQDYQPERYWNVNESQDGSVLFTITVFDPDADSLTYNWYVNSQWVTSGVPAYELEFDFTSAGYHDITVNVDDGEDTVTQTWYLQIINVNRPPVLLSHEPEQEQTVNETSYGSLYLSVNVYDPDGDYLTYQWTQNEQVQYGYRSSTYTFQYNHESAGEYVVRASASDSEHTVTFAWLIEVLDVNVPPTISSAYPYRSLYYNEVENGSIDMSVSAYDPEGGELTYQWFVDDLLMPGANETSFTFRYGFDSAGTHYVNVSVNDTIDEATYTWTVYLYDINRPPLVRSALPVEEFTIDDTQNKWLEVDARDLDGDALVYYWYVNSTQIDGANESTYRIIADRNVTGNFTYMVLVTDERGGYVQHTWNVTIVPYVEDKFEMPVWATVLIIVAVVVGIFGTLVMVAYNREKQRYMRGGT
jgi:uncharacterized MnhB-related membrane protein